MLTVHLYVRKHRRPGLGTETNARQRLCLRRLLTDTLRRCRFGVAAPLGACAAPSLATTAWVAATAAFGVIGLFVTALQVPAEHNCWTNNPNADSCFAFFTNGKARTRSSLATAAMFNLPQVIIFAASIMTIDMTAADKLRAVAALVFSIMSLVYNLVNALLLVARARHRPQHAAQDHRTHANARRTDNRGAGAGRNTAGAFGGFGQFKPPAAGGRPPRGRSTGLAVGTRVSVDGKGRGTVRFFGKHHLEGTPRYGVQLDQPNGKNDGAVKGYRYFRCRQGYGVLVKEIKVRVLV